MPGSCGSMGEQETYLKVLDRMWQTTFWVIVVVCSSCPSLYYMYLRLVINLFYNDMIVYNCALEPLPPERYPYSSK